MFLNQSVSVLKGVGPGRQKLLEDAGLFTVRDLLEVFPRSYLDMTRVVPISDLDTQNEGLIRAELIAEPRNIHTRGRFTLTQAKARDESGVISLVWFNQPYMINQLKAGETYYFRGRCKVYGAGLQMQSPKARRAEATGRDLEPVYPLWKGMSQKILSNLIDQALSETDDMTEPFDADFEQAHRLISRAQAYRDIHRPQNEQTLLKARRRLVFDEFFWQQLAAAYQRQAEDKTRQGLCFSVTETDEKAFWASLPFKATGAQARVADELKKDFASGRPLNRLIQGDVGSGKTLLAEYALYTAVKNGYQGAMMAPTEILARQHFEELKTRFEPFGIKVEVLLGAQSANEKKGIYERLDAGFVDIIVGTHALIQEKVRFARLGLVITDEQHRFGVRARLSLAEKAGGWPHILIMSATPIPRTLAMTLYGDMDISVVDELPPGRKEIKTYLVDSSYGQRLRKFIRNEVAEGRQVYIICPLVGDNEDLPREEAEEDGLQSAQALYDELSGGDFKDLKVGLLHGRMKACEKEQVMEAFVRSSSPDHLDVLVSTTVVEVGVNVPNASLMIIENAERFGLAQLHQLRGRVGRGASQAYCVLISDSRDMETRRRLEVLTHSTDGFFIAEEDLKERGAGDLFGLRQHGIPSFKVADPYTDTDILKEARDAAKALMEEDPGLSKPSHRLLDEGLREFFVNAVTIG